MLKHLDCIDNKVCSEFDNCEGYLNVNGKIMVFTATKRTLFEIGSVTFKPEAMLWRSCTNLKLSILGQQELYRRKVSQCL